MNYPVKCIKGFEVTILHSQAGYYVGTVDEYGFPNCRLSGQYADTNEKAEMLLLDRQIGCAEIEWCNGGKGCFNH